MITAKRNEVMENLSYPKTHNCLCGRQAELLYKDVKTKYNNTWITVHNVPTYECASNHVKLARITRVKMNRLLKTAYDLDRNSIEYND